MEGLSVAGLVWWWIGFGLVLLVVIPLVLSLVARVLTHISEIKSYANDILEHGVNVTKNLDPVPALNETDEQAKRVGDNLSAYAAAIDRM